MSVAQGVLLIFSASLLLACAGTWLLLRHPVPGRLQPHNPKAGARIRQELPLIAGNLVLLVGGSFVALSFLEGAFVHGWPGLWSLLGSLLFVFALEDTCFYFWHRLLHRNRWMYRKIHRLHHRAHDPLPIEWIATHPVEWGVGAIGPALAFTGLWWVNGAVDAWAFWTYLAIRQAVEVNLHSGTPVFLSRWLPFGSSAAHDLHHARPNSGNYGSLSSLWDRLLGTVART